MGDTLNFFVRIINMKLLWWAAQYPISCTTCNIQYNTVHTDGGFSSFDGLRDEGQKISVKNAFKGSLERYVTSQTKTTRRRFFSITLYQYQKSIFIVAFTYLTIALAQLITFLLHCSYCLEGCYRCAGTSFSKLFLRLWALSSWWYGACSFKKTDGGNREEREGNRVLNKRPVMRQNVPITSVPKCISGGEKGEKTRWPNDDVSSSPVCKWSHYIFISAVCL